MEKIRKRSRNSLEDDGSHLRRSTRSRTQRKSEPTRSRIQRMNQQQSPRERTLQVEKAPEKHLDTGSDEALNLRTSGAVDLTPTAEVGSQRINHSLEENLLAFLDGSANADPDEILEDKMMFLEATHSICVVQSLAHVPTPKMCQAIMQFIQESHSVGLTISSFELLTDLERRHPRVATADIASPDPDQKGVELIVDQKVWSPLDESCKELATPDRQPVMNFTTEVPSNIFALMEAISRRLRGTEKPSPKKVQRDASECGRNYIVAVSQFMMFQHLMSLLRTDLRCRLKVFNSSNQEKDFTVLQESYIYKLLCRLSQAEKKSFLMNLDYMMDPDDPEEEVMDDDLSGLIFDLEAKPPQQVRETGALQATPKDFGRLASDLLVLVMKLDSLNQEFGVVSTSLSRRRNRILFDTLLSICTKASTLDAYLKAVHDPSAKVRFVMDYFMNFSPKPVAQEFVDCGILDSVDKLLACFTDLKTLKAVVKVFKEADTLPLLLSHAFQACLLLHSLDEDQSDEQIRKSRQESRTTVCNSMVIAFNNLQTIERETEMLPVAEQTLFLASRISVPS